MSHNSSKRFLVSSDGFRRTFPSHDRDEDEEEGDEDEVEEEEDEHLPPPA